MAKVNGTKNLQTRHISTTIGKRRGLLAGASVRGQGREPNPGLPSGKKGCKNHAQWKCELHLPCPNAPRWQKIFGSPGGGGGHGRRLRKRLASSASGAIQHSPISHSVGPDHRLTMGGWGSLSTLVDPVTFQSPQTPDMMAND